MYVFDALPMAVVLVICSLWYVGDITKYTPSGFEMVRDTLR